MGTDISQKRMTETWTGRAACLLLALVWFVSMGVADANAYSYTPLLAGLALAILLAISAMIRGAKVVQLSKTAWFSLGIGGYFLVRCLCSPSVVESWQEASTILGCGVFYVAGIYAAQGRSFRTILGLLVVAGLLNLLYFGLMHYTDVPMEWAGRPAVGPCSVNHRPVTLFIYKNHASAFLCMVGMLLFAAALWVKSTNGLLRLGICTLALLCVLFSAECHSRSPYFMAPVLLLGGWVLWVVIKMYTDDKLSVGIIFSSFIILGMLGISVCSAVMEPDILRFFQGIDSHSRFQTWQAICRLLPETPPWGHGALSVQWLMLTLNDLRLPYFGMANLAHNEYLQAWVDYGLIGLFCMLFVIGQHLFRGFRILASEAVSAQQRIITAMAMLCICGWSSCSFVDFFWHHFAIAGMTAFAAGITGSPYPHSDVRKGIRRKIKRQTTWGKSALTFLALPAAGCCLWLISRTYTAWDLQWTFNNLATPGADETGEKRHALLAEIVPNYPATALMDHYFRIPRTRDDWEKEAVLLQKVLTANPRQLHTATMLAETLSRHGQFEEAERVYRRYYPGDGSDGIPQGYWANHYALNLLRRGQYLLISGNQPEAYSLMVYALRIVKHQPHNWRVNEKYRGESKLWGARGKYMPDWEKYLKARRQDIAVLKLLKVQQDNSWQAPMEPGGKPALYRRYGAPESLEKADSAAAAPSSAKKE